MQLRIAERHVEPDITVVQLSGTLELGGESQRIETLIDDLVKRGSLRVVLDMSGIGNVDSAGIGTIALASGRLREAGGKLTVVAPDGKVLQMLKLTQLTAIVTVCPTEEAAVASV